MRTALVEFVHMMKLDSKAAVAVTQLREDSQELIDILQELKELGEADG